MDSATPPKARELSNEGGWNNFVILTANFYLWLLGFDCIESDSENKRTAASTRQSSGVR